MFSADLGGYTAPLPDATNPPFQKVALLLHGDGTNGAQNNTFVDYSYPGGYAVSFDGSGDTLSNTTANVLDFGTSDFTIEYWLYPSSSTSYNHAGHIGQATDTGLCVGTDGSGNIYATTMAVGYNTDVLITVGAWQHIAWVRSGTTLKAYKNGVNIGTFTGVSTNFNSTGFAIGALRTSDFAWTIPNGFISNMRVVKGTALYTSNFTPSNQPLTAVSGTSLLTCQSATIVDNSPNAFTITAYGDSAAVSSKTITRTGNVAQGTFSPFSLAEGQWSNYFDGTGDYLETADSVAQQFGTGDFTVEGWVYRPDNSTSATIVSKWGTLGWALVFYTTAGNTHVGFYGSEPSVVVSDPDVFPLSQWVHVAATRSGTTTRLFVNGALKATATDTRNYNSTATTCIGSLYGGGGVFFWTGYISNVRLVKGTAVYTANFTPPTSPLTAITNTSLLTCQSNRFKDNSSNNFTITPAGDTKVTAFSPFAPSAAYSASTNGGSGYFDGSGDYLTYSGTTFSGDFTIEAFVYATAMPAFNMICGSTSSLPYFAIRSTSVELGLNSGNYPGFNYTFVTGNWYHIAWVRQSGINKVFVNGIQLTITSGSASDSFTFTIDAVGMYDNGQLPFNGYISNFRIVNGTALYTANFTPPSAPLTAVANTQLLLNCTNAGIVDNAGKNDIETVGNAQVSTSVKKYGTGSIYCAGTTADRLTATVSSNVCDFGTGDFTVEGWFYYTAAGDHDMLCFRVGTTIKYYFYWYNDGRLSFYDVQTTFNPHSTNLSIPTNTWSHIAWVRTSDVFKIFLNGVQVASSSYTTTMVSGIDNVIIGSAPNRNSSPSYIDDLRITKGQALYTANFTPPTQAFPNV